MKGMPVELLSLIHCPITLEPIREPVITPQGIVFEKQALIEWVKKTGTCPMTREKLTTRDIKAFDPKKGASQYTEVRN